MGDPSSGLALLCDLAIELEDLIARYELGSGVADTEALSDLLFQDLYTDPAAMGCLDSPRHVIEQ